AGDRLERPPPDRRAEGAGETPDLDCSVRVVSRHFEVDLEPTPDEPERLLVPGAEAEGVLGGTPRLRDCRALLRIVLRVGGKRENLLDGLLDHRTFLEAHHRFSSSPAQAVTGRRSMAATGTAPALTVRTTLVATSQSRKRRNAGPFSERKKRPLATSAGAVTAASQPSQRGSTRVLNATAAAAAASTVSGSIVRMNETSLMLASASWRRVPFASRSEASSGAALASLIVMAARPETSAVVESHPYAPSARRSTPER